MVHSPNVHLTLAFLGDVPAGRVVDATAAADEIAVPPFELRIDTRGYWRHNRIVWAGAARCPPPLRDLVARLTGMLGAAGFQCETREYVPHITLLREARRAPLLQINEAIAWRAKDFVLMRSVHRDAVLVYDIVQRWPLKA
jgi:RNA 2',3'-cyclic 3'-phosphodiesterase